MPTNVLTDAKVRSAKPGTKPYKLADGAGLFLWVSPTAKIWRLKFRLAGREGALLDRSLSGCRLGQCQKATTALRRPRDSGRFIAGAAIPPLIVFGTASARHISYSRCRESKARTSGQVHPPPGGDHLKQPILHSSVGDSQLESVDGYSSSSSREN